MHTWGFLQHFQDLPKLPAYIKHVVVVVVTSLSHVGLFCHPTDYSPPVSSVHGISQEILEWIAISFSRGSS